MPVRSNRIMRTVQPDEIYNLGAQSHVRVSFDMPGIHRRGHRPGHDAAAGSHSRDPACRPRFYQASSSARCSARSPKRRRTRTTPFHPRSPYGVREGLRLLDHGELSRSYGLFACNGILFNHESPRRGETFVTRKITRAAARIKHGLQDKLYLGNLDAQARLGLCAGTMSRRCG